MGVLRPRSPLARPSDPGGAWHSPPGENARVPALTATLALGLHVGEQSNAYRPPPCAGDGAGALSVSALRVRLGQDRLSDVRGSGAGRLRERHLRPRTRLCQQKLCNFLTRIKPL